MFENNDSNTMSYSNSSSNSNTNSNSNLLMNFLLILLIVFVSINVLYYYFAIDVIGSIKNVIYNLVNTRQVDINVVDKAKQPLNINISNNEEKIAQIKQNQNMGSSPLNNYSSQSNGSLSKTNYGEQVFNVPGNYYNYSNAKAVCNAYGARLAKYDEIENTYKNGGEWCNYGWSEGQMALFPTQGKTYNLLQGVKDHEHDCGRPGINGGYIANPEVRFGVNCYGNKPRMTKEDEEYMDAVHPIPQTQEDAAFQKNVDYWKTQVDQMVVAPFNYDTWSKI
jgi:hypothetical protein